MSTSVIPGALPQGVASAAKIPPAPATIAKSVRLTSIDALRGFVMLLMLVDHTREFFYSHVAVGDPMAMTTPVPLFFTRLTAHLCAPVFVALTGLSAYLYGARRTRAETSAFLLKRGLFLVLLELTLVNLAWRLSFGSETLFLQVIWVIGLSMIALAALIHLPRPALIAVGAVIVLGHNLLDPIAFAPSETGHALWAILHDRGFIELPWGRARTSYPLLPWIGTITLGYAIGPWFGRDVAAALRLRRLAVTGIAMIAGFVLLRSINVYGDTPWQTGEDRVHTLLAFLNVTKYPPSADFLLLTLGIGALLLAAFERIGRPAAILAILGGAPLFFYLVHLYALDAVTWAARMTTDVDGLVRVPGVAWIWIVAAVLAVPAWFACRWFAGVKRSSDQPWMRYL